MIINTSKTTLDLLIYEKHQKFSYISNHTEDHVGEFCFVRLNKDMKAFKHTVTHRHQNVVVNLIIPGGTKIFIGFARHDSQFMKCRAERAFVHSQSISEYQNSQNSMGVIDNSYSAWLAPCKQLFNYKNGAVVKPMQPFDNTNRECTSGIHFFVTLHEAYYYR